MPRLDALPTGKTRYPLYRKLSEPQGPSGRVWKQCPHWDSIPARRDSLHRLSYYGPHNILIAVLYVATWSNYCGHEKQIIETRKGVVPVKFKLLSR